MGQSKSKRCSTKFNPATVGAHLSTNAGAIAAIEVIRAGRIYRGQHTAFEDAQLAGLRSKAVSE